MMGSGARRRVGVNERRARESRRATRYEQMSGASRWLVRRGLKFFILFVFVALLGWGGWQGWHRLNLQSYFTLRHVEIIGNHILGWDEVLACAGIELGMPMNQLQPDSIEQRISKLSLVREVDVSRVFPFRLRIQISEVEPLFLMSGIKKGWLVYSDKGTLMPLQQDLGLQLPVVSCDRKYLPLVVNLLNRMRTADPALFALASQVSTENSRWSEIFFRNVGHKVIFANHSNDPLVFHHYRLLTQSMGGSLQGINVIDMRFPGFAVASSGSREKQDG